MISRSSCIWILVYSFASVPLISKSQIDSALLKAIKECDPAALRARLNSQVNINAADSNGANPLMWAVFYCDLPMVKALVANGAKPSNTGLLYPDDVYEYSFAGLQGITAYQGKLEVIRYLADSLHLPFDEREYNPSTGKRDGWTPLSWAVDNSQVEVVKYLLSKGANVNITNSEGSTPLTIAAAKQDWEIFHLLVRGGGRAKFGKQADDLTSSAVELQKNGKTNGDRNKELLLQEFILQLKKVYFGEAHFSYAATLNHIAYLNHLMGRYERALPMYEQSISLAKKTLGEQHYFYAGILHNLAYLYRDIGQNHKALASLEKAEAIARKELGESHPDYATSLQSLASAYRDMGQFKKAFPLAEKALEIRKKALGEEHTDYALSLIELALLFHQTGQYEKAGSLYERAIAIRKKTLGADHPFYAKSIYQLGLLFRDMGLYDKALVLHEQAKHIRKRSLGEEHPDYAESLNNMGVLYHETKQYDKALPFFTEASASTLKHLRRTYTTLSEQEKMTLLDKEFLRFSYLPSLLFSQHIDEPSVIEQVYNNQLALKGIVLEDQKTILNTVRKSKDSTILSLYESWYSNKVELGRQLLLPISDRRTNLDSLEDAINHQEQQLSGSTGLPGQHQQRVTCKAIAERLKEAEATIEFISFKIYNKKWLDSTMYAALILRKQDSVPQFVPLFEERELRRLLGASTNLTTNTNIQQLYGKKRTGRRNVSDSLYTLVWKPLEKYLDGVQKIYYAPEGLLHRISFYALPVDSSKLLLDKYEMNQLLSTRSIALSIKETTRPQTAHVWGNINYSASSAHGKSTNPMPKSTATRKGFEETVSSFNLYTEDTKRERGSSGGWKPLPASKAEMDSMRYIFELAGIQQKIVSGSFATEEAFKSISGGSPQVLHLATHGFFLPVHEKKPADNLSGSGRAFTMQQNPMFRSGLVLAGGNETWKGEVPVPGKEDGILTAYEIAQMDLTGTDLVVLSACETALGDLKTNEGVIGLQRALKMAGVKQMMLSLWQVPDKATMELITLFYKSWLSGLTTRESLRKAQLELKEKYKQPYFWAAFVLIE